MNKETKKRIMMWTFGILCVVGLLLVFYGSVKYDKTYEKEVKCFDRYNNEIEGLICTDNKTDFSGITITGFTIFGISLFLLLNIGWFYDSPF